MTSVAYNAKINDNTAPSPDEQLAGVSSDLSVQFVHDVVLAAYDPHVNGLSDFAPLGSKGTELQMRATENLRDRLCSMGWELSNAEQVPCVFSRRDNIRIACSTDGGASVGVDYPAKPTLREKGKGTIRLAGHKDNNTPPFPEFEAFLADDELQKFDGLDFYYLLMHLDETREEIRVELSKPVFSDKGVTLGWDRRIILPPISISSEPPVDIKSVPAPEIAVVRKAS